MLVKTEFRVYKYTEIALAQRGRDEKRTNVIKKRIIDFRTKRNNSGLGGVDGKLPSRHTLAKRREIRLKSVCICDSRYRTKRLSIIGIVQYTRRSKDRRKVANIEQKQSSRRASKLN